MLFYHPPGTIYFSYLSQLLRKINVFMEYVCMYLAFHFFVKSEFLFNLGVSYWMEILNPEQLPLRAIFTADIRWEPLGEAADVYSCWALEK